MIRNLFALALLVVFGTAHAGAPGEGAVFFAQLADSGKAGEELHSLLDSMFPNGIILIAIGAFVIFSLGVLLGTFLGFGMRIRQEGRLHSTSIIQVTIVFLMSGAIASFLYYHFVWSMLCRQYAC